MLVYSQLKKAQLEGLGSDPSQGTTGRIWVRTDTGKVRYDDGSIIRNLGGTGGGSGFRWWLANNAPTEETLSGLELLDFDSVSTQKIYGMVKLSAEYAAGTQVKLSGGLLACSAVTGNVLMKATASLIEPGSTVLDTYSNTHTSTNAEITVNAVASTVTAIGDIDLSDSSGEINSVALAANDLILVELKRDNASESTSAAADARVLRNSFEVVS